jgi:serine/threonine protein kinase
MGYSHEYVRSIVARALEMDDPAQRQAFIESTCSKDPQSLREVLELIELAQMSTGTASTETVESRYAQRNLRGNHCFAPGQVVDDRFRILEFINQGAMGEVYAALELNLQQAVALKTIRPNIAAHPGIIERFKTEVKQSLRITHPNVCRVYQLASHQDSGGKPVWFLTMELLEGPTLGSCLAEGGPIPFERALVLIRQMVSGLACAHQAGIVHRDLKPGNLMLVSSPSTGERLVITDFGLAVSASPREAGGRFGTPAYMAPEQASGGPVGPQADLFALGLIVCEMLTGNRPALDLSSAEKCGRQVNEWLASHPKLPPRIRPVVMRCLQFRPEDRFRDAREIVPLLDAGKPRSKIERAVAASSVLAALIALAAVVLPALNERIVSAVQLTPDNAVSGEPSLSTDGKYLAYMSSRADSSNRDIWFQALPDGDPRRLTRNPSEDTRPSVSRDGKVVAFRSERDGGGIYLVGADGTGERLLAAGGRDPAFSPDGRTIAYWRGTEDSQLNGELYLYPLNSGPPRRLASGFDDARFPTWSADGRLVLFLGCRAAVAEAKACPDWWAADPNGGEPANMGVVALLRGRQLEPDFPPRVAWRSDHALISAKRGRTFHLWDILTTGAVPRAVGRPLQITFGDQDEKAPAVAENGTIALEHVNGALHLWRIGSAPARSASASGSVKLTDSVGLDCCPAVSRDAHWLFFTRKLNDFWQLMKIDLGSAKESLVYASNEDKLWPLPSSNGDIVALESRSENQHTIVIRK